MVHAKSAMQWSDERFEIRQTRETGRGLFARAPLRRGDFLLEYTGARVPSAVADDMKGRYLFEVDDEWTVDGDAGENTAKYINHACDPNTEAQIEDGRIKIYATRGIAAGEELTLDYGDEYFDEFIKPEGCKCAKCLASGAI